MSARHRLVVIGNGMVGQRFLETLVTTDTSFSITVLGEEPRPAYDRVQLSSYFSGRTADDLSLVPEGFFERHGIDLRLGERAVRIDRAGRRVHTASGLEVDYDTLVLATGSYPFVPPVPGRDRPGCFVYRTIEDLDAIRAAAAHARTGAVIGGGLLGLEAAKALLRRGLDVTVVHQFDTLMERHLDAQAAEFLRSELESRGLKFRMPARTVAILGHERATGLLFDDGSTLEADLIVLAVGVRPNIDLARRAGLRCDRGILVNDTLQTFDPSIYAVGECVQHRDNTFGMVAPLWQQARVCAVHLAESGAFSFTGALPSAHLRVSGIELYSAGEVEAGEGTQAVMLSDRRRGVYKRLVIRDNRLRGAVLYGDAADAPWYLELITAGRDITSLGDGLLFGRSFVARDGSVGGEGSTANPAHN